MRFILRLVADFAHWALSAFVLTLVIIVTAIPVYGGFFLWELLQEIKLQLKLTEKEIAGLSIIIHVAVMGVLYLVFV